MRRGPATPKSASPFGSELSAEDRRTKDGFAPILIVIAIALSLGIGAIIYSSQKPKTSAPTSQPSPTPNDVNNREPNGSAETANWKIFTMDLFMIWGIQTRPFAARPRPRF